MRELIADGHPGPIRAAKAWIAGTFHGLATTYVQEYLDEFCFRFNRRRIEPRLFERLVHAVGCSRLHLGAA